jgi:predicted MFS family arabinose efflux permease
VNRSLSTLALSSFIVTTDGTLVVGLLTKISADLHTSLATAGQVLTVYAVGYAAGGPAVIAATRRWRPERVLITSLVLFIIANLATALALSLFGLLLARGIAGAAAGTQMPTAAGLAGSVGPEAERGRALAIVVSAASASSVVGVPLGTLLGAYVGWRSAFVFLAAATMALLIALDLRTWDATTAPAAAHIARRPDVRTALILLTTLLWATGSFVFFSYFGVVLQTITGVSTTGVAVYLFLFGVAGVGGAIVSGKATDAFGALVVIPTALLAMIGALLGLSALAPADPAPAASIVLTGALVALYGLGTWAVTPPQQHRLMGSGHDSRLLLSLNASALYGGVAAGAATGGALLSADSGIAPLCLVAAAIELAALGVACTSA